VISQAAGRLTSMSYLDVDGLSLYCEAHGAGEPLLDTVGDLAAARRQGPGRRG